MNIKSRYRKEIVAMSAAALLSIGLVGCSKETSSQEKEVSQQVEAVAMITKDEATDIFYEKYGDGSEFWSCEDETEEYYYFYDSEGADYRFAVDKYNGEVFYECAGDMGNLIAFDDYLYQITQSTPSVANLVSDITPKLKDKSSLSQVKQSISSKMQELLNKYNFKVTDATETNDFVISNTTYNKYTTDYNQLMYYLFSEDFSNGIAELNICLSQEIHSDYIFNEEDNFIKLLYDTYVYITSSEISISEFTTIIQNNHKESQSLGKLTDRYLGLTIENESLGGNRRKLTMKFTSEIEGLIKSKYYKNEYETVAKFKEVAENKKNEIKSINNKYGSIYTKAFTVEGIHKVPYNILQTSYSYGKNRFMELGEIHIAPESENNLFTQEEVDRLKNILKIALGSSSYEKIDESLLNVENLNAIRRSQNIKLSCKEIIKNENISDDQMSRTYIEMNNAIMYMNFTGLHIEFSVPVVAEGIRGI